jgi:ADP-heptose:LPS heptosyltransferase
MRKTLPIEELMLLLGAVRRRIAPVDSRRERLLRSLYVPILLKLETRALSRVEPNPFSATEDGVTVPGVTLPPSPRILILKTDHIGDFIVSLPAMRHLRDHFPNATYTLVCGSWSQDWARELGMFQEIVVFDGMRRTAPIWTGFTPQALAEFDALPLGRFDIAIDLRHDPDTRVLLAKVDAAFRAGFTAPAERGGALLDVSLPNVEHISVSAGSGRPMLSPQRLLLLASAVTNSFSDRPHPTRLLVNGPPPALSPRPYAILAPGAGGEIRMWNVSRLQEVGAFLIAEHDLDIVVVGTEPERKVAEAFAAALPAGRVHSAIGMKLADLPNLVFGTRLYVGNDTGPTHLAATLGVPTVSVLSGIPDGDVWRTIGERVRVVRGHAACSPCHLMEIAACPHGVVCLDVIKTEDVIEACRQLL